MSVHDPSAFSTYPELEGYSSRGRFERVLRAGKFAISAELNPPDSCDPEKTYRQALVLSTICDVINATDASAANCHMSSLGICALLTRAGYSPVLQISCRDRNRIAIQGDVLGAAAMGVHNVLCLTGDGVESGDHPQASPVFDLESTTLLEIIRGMRDDRVFQSGRRIEDPPKLFLGAAANPFAPPYDLRPLRLARKIAAGAQFVQTQYCFDIEMLKTYMARVRDLGLDEKCFILIGVGPLASAKAARWIRSNVPGVHIPDAIIARLEGAQSQKREGKQICVDMIQQIRDIPGVSGVHIMAYRQEELVAEIVKQSGILKRRDLRPAEPVIPNLDDNDP